jgi:penicillin-insensitive murein endopeptidase
MLTALLGPAAVLLALLRPALDGAQTSVSHGTPSGGHLEHGKAIPPWGAGYRTYSYLGSALGRQYVNGDVRDTLLEAFRVCAARREGRTFVLGETGWPGGGPFWPHRTHRNGMSVDVFVPLADAAGRPAMPGTWPWNLWGYALELDARGRLGNHRIDFEALADLLLELQRQAARRRLRIARVILAPEYLPRLLEAGPDLAPLSGVFLRTPAWVRHDDHVHVDFAPADR